MLRVGEETVAKDFFVNHEREEVPLRVVISKGSRYVFLFRNDRIVATLSANDVYLIKDELETERAYRAIALIYLTRLVGSLAPEFELALKNEAFIDDVSEEYAKQMRNVSPLDETEEMRQQSFMEAIRLVDYRLYVKKDDAKVGA